MVTEVVELVDIAFNDTTLMHNGFNSGVAEFVMAGMFVDEGTASAVMDMPIKVAHRKCGKSLLCGHEEDPPRRKLSWGIPPYPHVGR